MTQFPERSVRVALRLEGAAVFVAATLAYAQMAEGWLLYLALILLPDLSMAGYLAGPRAGAWAYNVGHSYVAPVLLAVAGWIALPALAPVAAVWIAHIGIDRALGYGLKSPTGFRNTHLGRIGPKSDA